ncbi:MAG: FAD-binding protein [Nitrospirae bacterium]|nr:FAD-binding protein [Nitrospirota bacterium]
MDDNIIKALKGIAGADNVSTDDASRAAYAYDATRLKALPDVVVRPGSEAEVAAVLRLASARRLPVVPRGAGSGLSGGSVPTRGGITLSFERMADIINIDTANRIVVVQPGVVTGVLQKAVEDKGLFYPPDPGSLAFCTIGGNVAENAGGMRALKYGVTRDYVIGLRAVLPSGEVIKTGVRTAKGVVGYDLTRLIVGSEGTLAVVTEITLRLVPKPLSVVTMTAYFADQEGAGRAVASIMASPVTPRCLEFLDTEALKAGAAHSGMKLPGDAGGFLLIETDGSPEEARRQADVIRGIIEPDAIEVRVAADAPEAAALWKLRRSTSQALFSIAPDKINEDTVVPVSRVHEALAGFAEIGKRHGLKVVCFGHAGDGNIHVNVMTDRKDKTRFSEAEKAVEEIFQLVLGLGGTISGEHGIGLTKAQYLRMELSEVEVDLLKRVKHAFDPDGILNPGKIF